MRRKRIDHFNRAGLLRLEAYKRQQRRKSALLFASVAGVTFVGGMVATNMPPGLLAQLRPRPVAAEPSLICANPVAVDGDTLRCGSVRVRLEGIDAPEMPGHCRPGRECTPGDPHRSQANLRDMVAGMEVACAQTGIDHYGRVIARCTAKGRDLSCAQVEDGVAVLRYAPIGC